MGEQEVVASLEGSDGILYAGSMFACEMPHHSRDEGLVVRDPVGHAVAQCLSHDLCVFGKVVGRVAVGPSPTILQRLGQIPVVQGGEGLDALC